MSAPRRFRALDPDAPARYVANRRVDVTAEIGDTVEINGVPCEIVSDEAAELVDCVVCVPDGVGEFPDNIHTVCADCDAPIEHRPHAPKRPMKICIECALLRVRMQ